MDRLRRYAIRTHRFLAWPAAGALLLFVVSGLCHPLMVWTGPRPAAFFPPQTEADAALLAAARTALAGNPLPAAGLLRLVPGPEGPLIQQSEAGSGLRRYLDPVSALEIPGHDRTQALWLARHYAGDPQSPVADIGLRTDFDVDYPAVNRLLPVWRVEFARADGLTLWVHTETGELAAMSNHWKDTLQSVFQWLHTQSALENVPWLRFGVMNLLMGLLLAFVLAGTAQLALLPSRDIPAARRRWHRRLALALYLPLLGLLLSGLHHLWFTELDDATPGQRLLLAIDTAEPPEVPAEAAGLRFDRMSLVQTRAGHRYWRLAVPDGEPGESVSRTRRFDGTAAERGALYLPADPGAPPLADEAFALDLARRVLGEDTPVRGLERVSRFGADYDFRNKRLPVWRVQVPGESLFVDTASGVLVERVGTAERLESLNFGVLHKWNPVAALVGRQARDGLTALFLGALLVIGGLGLTIRRAGSGSGRLRLRDPGNVTRRTPAGS